MLCSRCSEPIRPIVAVDIDGTLGDYHSHFLRFAVEWLGNGMDSLLEMSLRMYGGLEPFSWYCQRELDIDLATYRAIKLAYRQGGMKRTMPLLPGANRLIDTITFMKAELWVTTTRPYLSLDNIVPDTVEFLRRNEITPYSGILFDEDKYRTLADRVDSRRVVAVLDDLPEMYDEAEQAMPGVPILVKGKFNTLVSRTIMSDLDTCTDIVASRINSWKEDNA